MPPSDANPTLARALARLERYGYRNAVTDDVAAWRALRGDFDGADTLELFDLPSAAKGAVTHYLACKRNSDRLLATCEAAHAGILKDGLDRARSEAYAVVRDAYEDSVEDFGAAGAAVSASLKG
ncbi:MAG: hypothetical protein QGF53_02410 [Alphaproteobacteria bacterium]|jgi:hypothetical protein|nr:hypothetical protein [Alphaproteobacteria bacterium]